MDGSFIMSFPIEILKIGIGIFLIYTFPQVMSVYDGLMIPEIFILAYLCISLVMTLVYSSKKGNRISHLISG